MTLVVAAGLASGTLLAAASWWGSASGAGAPAAVATPANADPAPFEISRSPATQAGQPATRASASSAPLAASDDLPQDVARKPQPRGALKERDFYAEFLELGRRDPQALALRGWDVLRSEEPDAEKVALLRALQEVAHPQRGALFVHAALELPVAAKGGNVSVPWFAVQYLGRHARKDPQACAALQEIAWSRGRSANPQLRRMAVSALAAHGSGDDLRRLDRELASEPDEAVIAAAATSLAVHPDRRTAEWLRLRLGVAEAVAQTPEGVEE